MTRYIIYLFTLILLCSRLSFAQDESPILFVDDHLLPMSNSAFIGWSGYSGTWCKDSCEWAVIYGTINTNTPNLYAQYREQFKCKRVEIHGSGVDLISAINLGERIHACSNAITVGKPYIEISQEKGLLYFIDDQPGQCIGSCLYAFIGGVERQNYKGSEIILSPLDAMDEKKWKKLTDYVQEMRVSDQLIEAQRDVQKSGKPRTLTDQELKDWGILNAE